MLQGVEQGDGASSSCISRNHSLPPIELPLLHCPTRPRERCQPRSTSTPAHSAQLGTAKPLPLRSQPTAVRAICRDDRDQTKTLTVPPMCVQHSHGTVLRHFQSQTLLGCSSCARRRPGQIPRDFKLESTSVRSLAGDPHRIRSTVSLS